MAQQIDLLQPLNILYHFIYYSPVILVTCVTSMSLLFNNAKGVIYFCFLLACLIVRHFLFSVVFPESLGLSAAASEMCNKVKYSKYGNATFTSFIFAFTIAYLSFPMFMNDVPNFWIFSILLAYAIVDIGIKVYNTCVSNYSELFLDIILGGGLSTLIVALMYVGGSGKYLFFNEVSGNSNVCYKPDNQTFKCEVYKNGELIEGTELIPGST